VTRDLHHVLLAVVAVTAVVALAGMALLWPRGAEVRGGGVGAVGSAVQRTTLENATLLEVREVAEDDMEGLLPGAIIVDVTARLEETGETITFEMTDDTGETFAAGQRVRLQVIEQPGQPTTYFVSDFRRDRPLLVLTVLFLGAVIAFGRWQGVRALTGLGLTLLIIIGFIIPAILAGRSPVPVALVGSVAIMIVTLYLSHGYSRKTTAAVVGTALALLLTGALAVLFVTATNLTGFTSEEARLANLEVGGLSLRGLLLAGIIIGGLGVLDDVTMSQASTVFELHRANPAAGFADLLRGALNVGRDHIAATVNTLFLAYAGAALPLLILFSVGTDPVVTILTAEIVAVEIVRTLVGSIGLIAAVPLTTALAAAVVVSDPRAAEREALLGGHHSHGDARTHRTSAGRRTGPPASTVGEEGPPPATSRVDEQPEDDWEQRLRTAYRLRDEDGPSAS
jgi:uncharacterized membrane protein